MDVCSKRISLISIVFGFLFLMFLLVVGLLAFAGAHAIREYRKTGNGHDYRSGEARPEADVAFRLHTPR
jgi:Tfp pilus assembly protein PilX